MILCKWIIVSAIILQTLTLKEAFEAAAQLNEEVKWTEFDRAICKIFKLLLDRLFLFFAKRRKSVEKMIHRNPERPRSLNPRKVIAMAIFPIIVHTT